MFSCPKSCSEARLLRYAVGAAWIGFTSTLGGRAFTLVYGASVGHLTLEFGALNHFSQKTGSMGVLALPIMNLQVLVKSILSPPVTLITYCCVVSTLFTCEEFTCSHLYFFAWSSFNETALTVVTQRLNILLTHILHNSL